MSGTTDQRRYSDHREAVQKRLRRIEGPGPRLQRMADEDEDQDEDEASIDVTPARTP